MESDSGQAKALVETKPISDDHKLVAYWAAHGMDPKDIAHELGYGIQTIKKILKDKKVKLFVEKVRFKIYGDDPALHLKDCAKQAITVAKEIMTSKKTKDHVRLLAAQDFMNREFGKAGIDDGVVEGTVRKILQMLQKPPEEKKQDIEDAQYVDITPESQAKEVEMPVDEVEDWLDKNMK
jgi:predicted transcriptional regulator